MCVRHRSQRKNLGKPPGVAKTLKERLEGELKNNNFNVINYKYFFLTFLIVLGI